MNKIFSVPVPNVMTDNEFEILCDKMMSIKDSINDMYVGCYIPPFYNCPMGLPNDSKSNSMVYKLLEFQKKSGILVSATFNNINVLPSLENLIKLLDNLKPFYDAGLRCITLPHNHWVTCSIINERYPDMIIKNTILRKITTAQEFWDACRCGYDVVNLSRLLLRDRSTRVKIVNARNKWFNQTGKYVKIQLLVNEGCHGDCPFLDEHYLMNTSGISYHSTVWSTSVCPMKVSNIRGLGLNYYLKSATITNFRKDIEEILETVDVLKFFGRATNSISSLITQMDFMIEYVNGNDTCRLTKNDIILDMIMKNDKEDKNEVDRWRLSIKNCKFECWNCDKCDIYLV